MVFSSLIFLFLFLPAVLILYYTFESLKVRNWILVVSSILFYAWGEPVWVILLLLSATVDYVNGKYIEKYRNLPKAKLFLILSFAVNIGLLLFFKYSGFLVENINHLFSIHLFTPNFALPVGISFYVFMSLSYTLDVWFGKVKAQQSYANFLVYIANFHHLVAGPIIRYGHIAKEISERYFKWQDFHYGVTRFARGLFKKVCIANTAGAILVGLMSEQNELTLFSAWFAIILFSLQIYFDFSGYSDMAIGLGRMFGFQYHENFKHPYCARSISDFWRRWHISLSSFFKDYVYIPLGGNKSNQIRNIIIVWALTGLWHGASWNFILWGTYFALLLLIEKFILNKFLPKLPLLIQHSYAIFFILIGWTIFYFTDISQLINYFTKMFTFTGDEIYSYKDQSLLLSNLYFLIFAFVLCTPIREFMQNKLNNYSQNLSAALELMMTIVFIFSSISLLVGSTYNPFIYFRF